MRTSSLTEMAETNRIRLMWLAMVEDLEALALLPNSWLSVNKQFRY